MNTVQYPQPTSRAACGRPIINPHGGPFMGSSSDVMEPEPVDSPDRRIEHRLNQLEAALRLCRGALRDLRQDFAVGHQPGRPAEDPAEQPRRGRPRSSARCAADIVLTITTAGHPLTLDQLASTLSASYGRRTVAETAARLKAAGDLVNGGNGYDLPP
jgi:hypothetical protein